MDETVNSRAYFLGGNADFYFFPPRVDAAFQFLNQQRLSERFGLLAVSGVRVGSTARFTAGSCRWYVLDKAYAPWRGPWTLTVGRIAGTTLRLALRYTLLTPPASRAA